MLPKRRRVSVACLLLSVFSNAAAADADAPAVEATSALARLPVHVVALNDRLKAQIAYQYQSLDPMVTQNMMMNTPGVDPLTGALGGALAMAIVNASMHEAAEEAVRPAYATLRHARCDLPATETYARAVEAGVRATDWGGQSTVYHHQLEPRKKLDSLVGTSEARHVLRMSYSLTPDFSAVVSAVVAEAYSPDLPDAPRRWQRNAARTQVVYVVSDQLALAPKTDADVQAAVDAELARYAATPAQELIKLANGGDIKARRRAASLVREHASNLKQARNPSWTASQGAAHLARQWVADDCALLRQTLAANAEEMQRVVTELFSGRVPVQGEENRLLSPLAPFADEVAGERRITAWPSGQVVSRRGGDHVPLNFIGSWAEAEPLPEAR